MKTRLPRIGTYILEKAAYYKNRDYILGDTEETHKNISKSENTFKANLWFWSEVIYCLPGFLRNNIYWGIIMFSNYIKIAFRNLVKNKGLSFINITGLSIGIACCILILLYVVDETGYDKFHENGENIYRAVKDHHFSGGEDLPVAVTPDPLGPALVAEYPEIINSTRFKYWRRTIKHDEKLFSELFVYSDPSLFEMFTFPVVMGDRENLLTEPNSVILSEKLSDKLFGTQNPIGKTILVDKELSLKVTGVFKDIPKNSHLQFDAIVPFQLLEAGGLKLNNWQMSTYYTYVQLKDGIDYKEVNKKIGDIIERNRKNANMTVYLHPMLDIHLYTGDKFAADIGGHGDIEYVKIFTIVAFFILFIGCVNFMNLSTARSVKRAKEVSLRKVVGGVRTQIITQFFVESITLTFISIFIASAMVYLLLPEFNALSGKEISFWNIDSKILFGVLIIGIITGVISGSYPALFLSSFAPASVLKGEVTKGSFGSVFRKLLVVAQFSISVILIIGTIVVFNQLNFIHNKDLGFQKENIVSVSVDENIKSKIDVVKRELQNNPDILSVSLTNDSPIRYSGYGTSSIDWEGKDPEEKLIINYATVDEDYFSTLNMKLKEGRFFSKEFGNDSASVVINETAAKIMGMNEPLGKAISMWDDELTIVGVVKDIHYKKLDSKSGPLVFRLKSDWNNTLFVKMTSANIDNTIKYIENTLSNLGMERLFDYTFLEDEINEQYRSEQTMGKLFSYFGILAILISCLGLFGLTSYMVERRTKEIGIRKVLGASVVKLTVLLSKEFTLLVIISNLIAWPIGYYLLNNWLNDFAYRVDFPLWVLPLSAVIALVISISTISYQSIKAAATNPINSIKYE